MAWLKSLRWPQSLRWRYSLRALFVFITLFMLWGGYHTNRSWKERAAEEILRQRGASFDYASTQAGTDIRSRVRETYQDVVRLLWRERFITRVHLDSTLDHDAVEALIALPHLQDLSLQPVQFTPEENYRMHHEGFEPSVKLTVGALERILSRHKLKSLSLAVWVLTDDECQVIAQHHSLQEVSVFASELSEHGLADLITLPRLKSFTFSFCKITGAKLASRPGSHSLEVITCLEAPIGNEFAAFVGRSPAVARIDSLFTGVNDEFIAALGPHPSIQGLSLARANITDRSIPLLGQMPSLRSVELYGKSISQEAADNLQKSRPGLKVVLHPVSK